MNGYPKAVELFAFVLTRAAGTGHVANLVSLFFLPLGVVGIACLARLMGASRAWAAAAGAIWLLVPVCILQSASTYVDSSFASCVIALAASMGVATVRLQADEPRLGWREAVMLGLAIGAKQTGLGMTILAFAIVGIVWVGMLWRAKKESRRRGVFHAIALLTSAGALCCAVGGFWYVRDYRRAGTPLHPIGVSIAGHTIFPGGDMAVVIDAKGSTPAELRGLPTYRQIADVWLQLHGWKPEFFTVDYRLGGLGYFWPAGCLVAMAVMLCWAVTGRERDGRPLLLALAILIGAAFLCQPLRWWPRYTAWVYALGLPCFAAVATAIWDRRGRHRAAAIDKMLPTAAVPRRESAWNAMFRVWVFVCVVLAMVEGARCVAKSTLGTARMARREMLDFIQWRYGSSKWRVMLPSIANSAATRAFDDPRPIALGPIGRHPHSNQICSLGILVSPPGERHIVTIDEPITTETLQELRKAGIYWVLLDDTMPLPKGVGALGCRVEKSPGFHVITFGK